MLFWTTTTSGKQINKQELHYKQGCIRCWSDQRLFVGQKSGNFLEIMKGISQHFRIKFLDVNMAQWKLVQHGEGALSKKFSLLNEPDVTRVVRFSRLRWEHHVARMGFYEIQIKLLEEEIYGSRPWGGPKLRGLEDPAWSSGLESNIT